MAQSTEFPTLAKCPTGIHGLDEITGGGLPQGRPTLVCGAAGCGKSVLGVEFLLRGALEHGEPGVLILFEENAEEVAQNVASFGYDLNDLIERKLLVIDYVYIERSEFVETGEYDLEGLFVRLSLAIESIGARRIVLDTVEALFSGFSNAAILRAELRRLFRWLKERGLTAIITGERGDNSLTRYGLEEYVADCVILLDHRIANQVSTRRLRIVKYRGSAHGADEYPFLIAERGISVLPLSAVGLNYPVSVERISSGVPQLDQMLGGDGYYRGSGILISGTAGSGKTSVAAHFAAAACRRGECCLYLALEEAPDQIVRNLRSIGLDLAPWVAAGLLRFQAARPSQLGLEAHLIAILKALREITPDVLVMDPISSFISSSSLEVQSMLIRLLDAIKSSGVTALFTDLTRGAARQEQTSESISSLIDTWLVLRDIELNGERNRGLHILKSRGTAHSNQVREFVLSERGIDLVDVYLGPGGVLTGSARTSQEAAEQASLLARQQEIARQERQLDRKRRALDAEIDAQRAAFAAEVEEARIELAQAQEREAVLAQARHQMAVRRHAAADGDAD